MPAGTFGAIGAAALVPGATLVAGALVGVGKMILVMTVFVGAAVCAVVAAVVAMVVFRGAQTRGVGTAQILGTH